MREQLERLLWWLLLPLTLSCTALGYMAGFCLVGFKAGFISAKDYITKG